MLPGDSEDVERREVSCFASRFHIEFCADAPNEFRAPSFCGKHPGKKKQIARLHRFHINAERLRWRRKLDAKFFQPLLGTGGARTFGCCRLSCHLPYHLRSEEHTSELQSPYDLVCRLLLEKKKNK